MNRTSRARTTRTLAGAALASTALGTGCGFPIAAAPESVMFGYPYLSVVALTALAVPPTIGLPHGPGVTIVNRSDTPVRVRIWVARVDVSTAAGYADQKTADHLAFPVEPGYLNFIDAGRDGWVTGKNDAIVWIRFEPDAPDGAETEPIWVQFERPGPYKIEIDGSFDASRPNSGLEFYPLEDTAFSPLPRGLWIEEHDGIYAAAR